MKNSLTIRVARNGDGETIKNILAKARFNDLDALKWDNIYPYWLVAERDGLIVGCLQMAPARPVGWLEYLGVEQEISLRDRSYVVRRLLETGYKMLKVHGANRVIGFIPFEERMYKRILKRNGLRVVASGNMLAMEIE